MDALATQVRRNEEYARLAKAEDIQRSRPQWMVVYGVCSEMYWAFSLFDMTARVVAYSADPEDLIARMDQTERKFRLRPGEGGKRA
jgi:hypothetical protein